MSIFDVSIVLISNKKTSKLILLPIQIDVEIPIPHYFVSENAKVLKEREKLLGMILAKLGPQDKADVSQHDENCYE